MPGLNLPDDSAQSDTYPYAKTDERYVLIRKPDTQGSVVAKFDGGGGGDNHFPKALFDSESLIATFPGSLSELEAAAIDQTELTDSEKSLLEKAGFPTGI